MQNQIPILKEKVKILITQQLVSVTTFRLNQQQEANHSWGIYAKPVALQINYEKNFLRVEMETQFFLLVTIVITPDVLVTNLITKVY